MFAAELKEPSWSSIHSAECWWPHRFSPDTNLNDFVSCRAWKGPWCVTDCSFPPTPYLAQALSPNHTPLQFLCYGWLLPTFLFPLFKERHYIMLQAAHRANRSWLPFPGALNILKIFVILLATGGYNSLLAEPKSTSCQRISETICMILKSKNKMKWFYSHPTLPHILTTKSRALVLRWKKPYHLLLAPASHPFISKERRFDSYLGYTDFVDANQAQADCKVESKLLSVTRDLRDRGNPSQGEGCRLALLRN